MVITYLICTEVHYPAHTLYETRNKILARIQGHSIQGQRNQATKVRSLIQSNLNTDILGQPIISDVPSELIAEWPDKNGVLGRVLHSGHRSLKTESKYIYVSPTQNPYLFLKNKTFHPRLHKLPLVSGCLPKSSFVICLSCDILCFVSFLTNKIPTLFLGE